MKGSTVRIRAVAVRDLEHAVVRVAVPSVCSKRREKIVDAASHDPMVSDGRDAVQRSWAAGYSGALLPAGARRRRPETSKPNRSRRCRTGYLRSSTSTHRALRAASIRSIMLALSLHCCSVPARMCPARSAGSRSSGWGSRKTRRGRKPWLREWRAAACPRPEHRPATGIAQSDEQVALATVELYRGEAQPERAGGAGPYCRAHDGMSRRGDCEADALCRCEACPGESERDELLHRERRRRLRCSGRRGGGCEQEQEEQQSYRVILSVRIRGSPLSSARFEWTARQRFLGWSLGRGSWPGRRARATTTRQGAG